MYNRSSTTAFNYFKILTQSKSHFHEVSSMSEKMNQQFNLLNQICFPIANIAEINCSN